MGAIFFLCTITKRDRELRALIMYFTAVAVRSFVFVVAVIFVFAYSNHSDCCCFAVIPFQSYRFVSYNIEQYSPFTTTILVLCYTALFSSVLFNSVQFFSTILKYRALATTPHHIIYISFYIKLYVYIHIYYK